MLLITFFITFVILLIIVGYFLPTFIAIGRNKKNILAIFLINLFFGSTLIGWVVVLIWALKYEDKDYIHN